MTRILLVEDHEEIWDFLSRRLKRRGFEVVIATDGQEGVDKARSERPDIVLLDMNLPVMDGWTAAGIIRQDPGTASVPIIALTAHAMSGDREGSCCRLRRLPRQAGGFLPPARPDRGARAGAAGESGCEIMTVAGESARIAFSFTLPGVVC